MEGISATAPRWTEEGILFTKENMKKFNQNINEYMSETYENVELYNLNEFNAFYQPKVRQSERLTGEKIRLAREASFQNRQQIYDEVLKKFVDLAEEICVDSNDNPVIGERYGVSAIRKVFDNSTHFDILIAVNNTRLARPPRRDTRVASIEKIDNLVGFIIAEYGECKMKPDVWSVNLICAGKAGNRGLKGVGNVLLGAFLYCIKESNYKKEAVLELAGGYTNMAGFISYSKLGFNKDLSLYQLASSSSSWFGKTVATPSCFTGLGSLPMSVNLSGITSADIINRVIGEESRVVSPSDDDTGLFNATRSKLLKPHEQQDVITYSNILYRIEAYYGNTTTTITGPLRVFSSYEKIIYNNLRTQLINAEEDVNNVNMVQLIKQQIKNVYKQSSASPVPSPLPASPGSPFGSPPVSPTKSGWVCTAEGCVYAVGTGAGAVAGFMVGGPKVAAVGAAAGVMGAHKVVKGVKSLFGYKEGGKSKKKSKRTAKTRRKTKHR
jgi:hypothetical protein